MNRIRITFSSIMFLTLFMAFGAVAQAQLNRTFVSAQVGNDANSCVPTAPCRFLPRALSVTNPGGEIIILDSGGYGATLTINKSVTINAPAGVYAGMSVTAGSGVIINAAPSDVIIIRGLTLNGSGGTTGINFVAGGVVHVENCVVNGFTANGISIGTAGQLFLKDNIVRNNAGNGLQVQSTADVVRVSIDRTRFEKNNGRGLLALNNVRVTIRDSVAAGNGAGIEAEGNSASPEINIDNCAIVSNTTGISSKNTGGALSIPIIRVANTTVTNNNIGLEASGNPVGALLSRGNNTVEGNAPGGDGAFTGIINAK
jgi:hypothetical protein